MPVFLEALHVLPLNACCAEASHVAACSDVFGAAAFLGNSAAIHSQKFWQNIIMTICEELGNCPTQRASTQKQFWNSTLHTAHTHTSRAFDQGGQVVLCFAPSQMFRRGSSFLDDGGPDDLQRLATWDDKYMAIVMQSKLAGPLLRNMQRGLLVSTDFSGYDAPRECFRILSAALSKGFLSSQVPPKIHVVRSCDCGTLQRRCLEMQSETMDHGASCVFNDVAHRLDDDTRQWLIEASPTKKMSIAEAQAANKMVGEFLETNRATIFRPEVDSYCSMHRQRCPVFTLPALRSPEKIVQASPATSRAKTQPLPWWKKPNPFQRQEADSAHADAVAHEPVICNISGLVCTDYTPLGKRRGLVGAGLTEPMHALWLSERSWLAANALEEWYWTENSSAYPLETKQAQELQNTHHVHHVTVCPTSFGFPMRRKRTFSFGLQKAKWAWIGPSRQQDIQQEFEDLFGKELTLPGDVYLQAGEEDVHAFVKARSSHRKASLPHGWEAMPMRDYMTSLVPPGAMVRLAQYDKVRQDRQDAAGHFMADLDHNLDCGPKCGGVLPALDTHASIFSWNLNRLALGQELLQAQGVDFFPQLAGNRGVSPLVEVFNKFGDTTLRMFAGNAIHIPLFSAWLLYCIGNVRLRSEMFARARPLSLRASEPESDFDDPAEDAGLREPVHEEAEEEEDEEALLPDDVVEDEVADELAEEPPPKRLRLKIGHE